MHDSNENDPYIRSIEPESRHPEIFNLSKEAILSIEPLFSIPARNGPPSKLHITSSATDPFEL